MTDIAMSVSCNIDGRNLNFLLENIEDVPINTSSTITKHPVPSGDYVSDTMFKEPITMDVSGSFSMNGKRGIVISDTGDMTLENIETFFERIKNEGILCDLVKVKVSDNSTPCFTIRRNMALQSISWTEKVNSLTFRFSFQQVMQVEISEYDVDQTDENLPDYETPKTLNFTESLFNEEDVVRTISQVCQDSGITKEQFLNVLASYGKSQLVGYISGALAVLATVIIGGITSGGVLLVVGLAVAAVVFLASFIKNMVQMSKAKIHEFKVYKNEEKTKKEIKRYLEMNGEILDEFKKLNQQIAVYQVSSKKAHQAILTIDDEYYCFTFTRNNDNNSYGLTLLTLEGNIAPDSKLIPNVREGALKSLGDCNERTSLLKTNSGYQVFLLNTSEKRTDDLTECYILVSAFDMGKYNELVTDIIKSYLLY